ncbi:D-alanyl-D-alanine carboxypeptidase family protein [Aurantimonas sp. A2-1-M11]|uniref:D-alanyl-D-alanine carboxypeptidase family protein n=1 Tax=Aurantimonas sp. A2-1-M11 TaxID=3113712 RepID=UPI002F95ACA5
MTDAFSFKTILFVASLVLPLAGMSDRAFSQADDAVPRIETTAREALLVDGKTGTVLFSKNADAPFPPASLAKMMTMEIVFAAITDGSLSLDTEFPVSEHAWRTGGAPSRTSTMFAELKSQVPVSALIRGAIIQSANDAAIVIAEGMEGSEAAFAERMNARARELGMINSRFANPTGLPADDQYVTARDLITLARHIRSTYPALYAIYAEPAFEWNKIFQRNRNPLLSMDIGADGIETGFTEASGYSLVGATRDAGRVTFVAISGTETARDRATEARKLLLWAKDSFATETLFPADEIVGSANVFGGVSGSVALAAREPVEALLPADAPELVSLQIRYLEPLLAPIAEGQAVASLDILVEGEPVLSRDLHAAHAVAAGSFTDRALGAVRELAVGWLRQF